MLTDVLSFKEIRDLADEIKAAYKNYPPDNRGVASRSADVDNELRYQMLKGSSVAR